MTGTNAEQAAWAELDRLTDGSPGKLWRWSIPADPERDSDLILAAGLKAVADERDAAHRGGYEDAICWVYASAEADPDVLADFMEFYEPPTEAAK